MQGKIIVALARIAAGAAILITSMVTGENGTYQNLAILLLGLPIEAMQYAQKRESTNED